MKVKVGAAAAATCAACAAALGLWLVGTPQRTETSREDYGPRVLASPLGRDPRSQAARGGRPLLGEGGRGPREPQPAGRASRAPAGAPFRQPAGLPAVGEAWLSVVSSLDASPLAGAWCERWSPDSADETPRLARADASGRLAVPEGGSWRIGAPHYSSRILTSAPATRVVVLSPSRSVELRVLAGGEPVARARVVAESDGWRREGLSDRLGLVSFEDAPSDEALDLRVRALGYLSSTAVEPAGSEPSRRSLALERGAVLRGRVVDAEGLARAGAEVWAFGADALDAPQVIQSDALGEFELSGFTPGEEVAALAFTPGQATLLEARWLPLSGARTLRLLPRAELRVPGLEGELALVPARCSLPIPDRVRVLRSGGGETWARAARLPAGRYLVRVEGGAPRSVVLEPGQVVALAAE